jgi:hypothetical protein
MSILGVEPGRVSAALAADILDDSPQQLYSTEWQPLHFCVLCASGSGLGVCRSVVEGIRIVLTNPDGMQLCNSEASYM